jgi:hypothetical protein
VVANILTSGPSAPSSLGGSCTTKVGSKGHNSVASVKLTKTLNTGTVHTHVSSKKTKTGLASTASAKTQGINLLNGLISAKAITAVSKTARNSKTGKFSVSSRGTSLVDLVVNGKHIKLKPKPNTKIKLPGIGYVMLNEQGGGTSKLGGGWTVIGIHVVVNIGSHRAPAGTQLYVSVASSSVSGPAKAMLKGSASGTAANIANTILIGPSFPVGLGCLGTHGKRVTNSGAGVSIPKLVTSGTIKDTAKGNATSKRVYGHTSSTIEDLNVLKGLVTAKVIKASVTAKGKKPTKLSDHSKFIGLNVKGHPLIKDNVAPNTHFGVAGLGTLWLRRQIKTSKGITVVMVQLIIGSPNNKLHLPVGAIVDIGFANAEVL